MKSPEAISALKIDWDEVADYTFCQELFIN